MALVSGALHANNESFPKPSILIPKYGHRQFYFGCTVQARDNLKKIFKSNTLTMTNVDHEFGECVHPIVSELEGLLGIFNLRH